MLPKPVQGLDRQPLQQLRGEVGRVRNQKVSNRLHVFLERADFGLGLTNIHILFGFTVLCLLLGLTCELFSSFLLVDLDAKQRLAKGLFGLTAVEKSHWRLLILLRVRAHIEQRGQEVFVVL